MKAVRGFLNAPPLSDRQPEPTFLLAGVEHRTHASQIRCRHSIAALHLTHTQYLAGSTMAELDNDDGRALTEFGRLNTNWFAQGAVRNEESPEEGRVHIKLQYGELHSERFL